ncbi:MAG: GNAT family N-acetyltransferase [Candidatus Dojkabacteria bacterium]
MRYFRFEKLIRDKILDAMPGQEQLPIGVRHLNDEEFVHMLLQKVIEEAEEARNAQDTEQLKEELADIQELIDNLLDALNISLEELKSYQNKKIQKNGSFKKRIFMQASAIESDEHPWLKYYLERPEKYPEITCTITELNKTVHVTNFHTKKTGTLIPLNNDAPITEADIARISSICDTPRVFDILFAELDAFKGRRYLSSDAEYWVKKSRESWSKSESFVYLIRDEKENIVGTIDIKSTDLHNGEIGYWASENDPGWMTNALLELVKLAKNAGYMKVFGLVRTINDRSMKVLQRAGFTEVPAPEDKKEHYRMFELELV